MFLLERLQEESVVMDYNFVGLMMEITFTATTSGENNLTCVVGY